MKKFWLPVCVISLTIISCIFSCKKSELIGSKPPLADAGKDQSVIFPADSIRLDGRNSSDPDGKLISWQWKKISGPYSFKIRNEFSASTIVADLDTGVYDFELKVTDNNGLSARDTLQVIVSDHNRPPVANAGTDQLITYPDNSVYLDGSNSGDPDGGKLLYQWRKVAGPSAYTIVTLAETVIYVSHLELGLYSFELTVTDAGGLSARDTVNVHIVSCDNSVRPQVSARLIQIGALSEARLGMTVASAGNKIVFAGAALSEDQGSSGYGSSKVDIYDIVTKTWTSASLSQRRSHIAAVSAGNKIFFAGGRLGDGAFDELFSKVDIYDVSDNSWSSAVLSEKRAFIAAATVGNKVFFAGGEKDWNYNTSNVVDIFDISTGTWSVNLLSEPRAYISAITVDSKVYFAGGHRENRWYSSPSSRIDVYDNITNSWSVSNLYRPMGNLGSVAVDGKIYWSEGCNVEIKDVNSWNSAVESLSQAGQWNITEGSRPVQANGKLVFLRHWGDNTDKFDIYDIKTKSWSVGILPYKIHGASIIAVDNVIYVAGGWVINSGSSHFTTQVWKLEF